MKDRAVSVAKKFWEVMPTLMRSTVAEARRGEHNISPNHYRILHMLSIREFRLSDLAQHQDVSLPTMSDTAQTLVERGWLERVSSPDDRRVAQFRLTRKGQQVLINERKRLVAWVASRLNKLKGAEVEQVDQGLNLLLSVFDNPREVESKKEAG
jgi:DNA-binding MarR family transcriptional regulator